jgi:hypothetical protein
MNHIVLAVHQSTSHLPRIFSLHSTQSLSASASADTSTLAGCHHLPGIPANIFRGRKAKDTGNAYRRHSSSLSNYDVTKTVTYNLNRIININYYLSPHYQE